MSSNPGASMSMKNSSTRTSAPQRFGSALSVFLAPFAKRFIAGTTLAEALAVVRSLKANGFLTTLDQLGESVENARDAAIHADEYVVMLKALKEKNLDRNVSLKLTQIGLGIDPELCFANLKKIADAAEEMHGFVRVDMEGSDATDSTLDIVRKIKISRVVPVGLVLQAMLRRTPADIMKLIEAEITVRLCKGAYKEPEEIAYQDMSEIRRQFLSLAKRLITSGGYHGIATHDEYLIREIISFARSQKIPPERFEFQMLLGVRQKLQKKIIADGWRLRIYVPFGRAWLPYTWRRLRERKENVWFVVKSLFMR